ncbi:MAG: alpha/beta hydrolase [Chitinophagales bacterium]
MALTERIVEFILKTGAGGGFRDVAKVRRRMDNGARFAMPRVKGVAVKMLDIDGLRAAQLQPENAQQKVLLYLHGGAYVCGSIHTHKNLVGTLAKSAGIQALLIDYRLAPEYPYPAALEDAVKAYRYLLDSGYRPEDIAVAGDSAGGGLSLALLMFLRDQRMPLPKCAVLICPWLDLTNSSETYQTNKDVMLKKEDLDVAVSMYTTGKVDVTHPYVSPINGDFNALSDVLIHTGGRDALEGEGKRLATLLKASGIAAELFHEPKGIHVWHTYHPFFPHSKTANEHIAAFLRRQLK